MKTKMTEATITPDITVQKFESRELRKRNFQRRLPNSLSIIRLVSSFTLLFLTKLPVLFMCVYFMISITDFLDGFLARRWRVCSKLGAKLDALGDFAICAVGLICLLVLLDFESPSPLILLLLGIAILTKLIVFVTTFVRFHEFNMMHTYLNKLLGAALYFSVPICVYFSAIPFPLVVVVVSICFMSFFEDMALLFRLTEYDADCKGLYFELRRPR
ncbi:MAG: CDP-alcohol phosphatidyltransferase family protein [Oscillospiraceae bacterium]|jgi:CDP-diacylglycerol--glycerol-3-phosphate 3-phosphatidyltransferase|nr:CDP-alcohol phosphatidyltransferase family protein [Oscillospiraceae bacterium]